VNKEELGEKLRKVPVAMLFVVFGAYVAWDWYGFNNDPESPMIQAKTQLVEIRKETERLQGKVKEAQEFMRSLETKRMEIRKLAQELEEFKGTLHTSIDVPNFMKLMATEAKKVGLTVLGIRPGEMRERQYYGEQTFTFGFRGIYVQFLVFLDRLSNIQNIVRADRFDIVPVSASQSRFVELEGTVHIRAFRYLGTQADDVAGGKGAGGK
jgi:Tfp pilus assembly protein PilO